MSRWKLTAAVLGFLAVVVMPAGVAWAIWQGLPIPKHVSVFAAAFSDVVSPLFAALAFAGLIYTALMQREELSLQREELRETRAELKRAANAQEASEKALAAQVKVTQQSARLSAATALLSHYDEQMFRSSEELLKGKVDATQQQMMLDNLASMRVTRKEVRGEIFSLRDELRAMVHHIEIDATLPAVTGSVAGRAVEP